MRRMCLISDRKLLAARVDLSVQIELYFIRGTITKPRDKARRMCFAERSALFYSLGIRDTQ